MVCAFCMRALTSTVCVSVRACVCVTVVILLSEPRHAQMSLRLFCDKVDIYWFPLLVIPSKER